MTDQEKIQFEKDKVCYEQNCQSFRSLNQLMWQVPIIAMTVTGGLWFGVGNFSSNLGDTAKVGILLLPFIGNFSLMVVLNRVRYIIGRYLEVIKKFHEDGYVDAPGAGFFSYSRTVISVFNGMLGISGFMSLIGAIILMCGGKL